MLRQIRLSKTTLQAHVDIKALKIHAHSGKDRPHPVRLIAAKTRRSRPQAGMGPVQPPWAWAASGQGEEAELDTSPAGWSEDSVPRKLDRLISNTQATECRRVIPKQRQGDKEIQQQAIRETSSRLVQGSRPAGDSSPSPAFKDKVDSASFRKSKFHNLGSEATGRKHICRAHGPDQTQSGCRSLLAEAAGAGWSYRWEPRCVQEARTVGTVRARREQRWGGLADTTPSLRGQVGPPSTIQHFHR